MPNERPEDEKKDEKLQLLGPHQYPQGHPLHHVSTQDILRGDIPETTKEELERYANEGMDYTGQ